VPAGLLFLVRRPALWSYAALPALFGTLCLVSGLVLGAFLGAWVNGRFAPRRGAVPDGIDLIIEIGLWLGTVGLGLILGVGVALLVSAPLLELLSRKVELAQTGSLPPGGDRGLDVLQSIARASYVLGAIPLAWILSLIPLVGPVLGLLVAAHALATQETAGVLARRGLDFRAQRRWHRRWWPEGLGFGLAGLVFLAIPIIDIVLIPAIVVGGTRLVLELDPVAPEDSPAGAKSPAAEGDSPLASF
jgi:uncharacterized protein involved in cysteine biosynthesis